MCHVVTPVLALLCYVCLLHMSLCPAVSIDVSFHSPLNVVAVIVCKLHPHPRPVYPSSLAHHGFCFGWWISSDGFLFQADSSSNDTTDFTNNTER